MMQGWLAGWAMASAEELKNGLKLKNVRKYLQDKRLQWSGHLERMGKNAWISKCRTFKVSGKYNDDDEI